MRSSTLQWLLQSDCSIAVVLTSGQTLRCSRSHHVEKIQAGHGLSLMQRVIQQQEAQHGTKKSPEDMGHSPCIDPGSPVAISAVTNSPAWSGTGGASNHLIVKRKFNPPKSPREKPFSALKQPRVLHIPGELGCNSC